MAGHVRYTAVIDACVFFGMLKTDVLMSLCVRGLFAAKWSERIENEWVGRLSEKKPDKKAEIMRRRDTMREAVPDWAVCDRAIASFRSPDEAQRNPGSPFQRRPRSRRIAPM